MEKMKIEKTVSSLREEALEAVVGGAGENDSERIRKVEDFCRRIEQFGDTLVRANRVVYVHYRDTVMQPASHLQDAASRCDWQNVRSALIDLRTPLILFWNKNIGCESLEKEIREIINQLQSVITALSR